MRLPRRCYYRLLFALHAAPRTSLDRPRALEKSLMAERPHCGDTTAAAGGHRLQEGLVHHAFRSAGVPRLHGSDPAGKTAELGRGSDSRSSANAGNRIDAIIRRIVQRRCVFCSAVDHGIRSSGVARVIHVRLDVFCAGAAVSIITSGRWRYRLGAEQPFRYG